MTDTDTARGVLLGLACGDALGRPIEFKSARRIDNEHGTVTEMLGDGAHGQPPGTITDDAEMALCIARSLADCGTFDPADVAGRFLDWYRSDPFDIGLMTVDALRHLRDGASWDEAGQTVWEQRPEGQNAGNGSVMRCAPLAVAYGDDPARLADVSRQSSRITHADPRCTVGCAVLNLTIAGVRDGSPSPLADALGHLGDDVPDELGAALDAIAAGESPPELPTSGYVVHTLQTALHDGLRAADAETAIVTAVNRGGDTDTIGAVTGAVAGARFGESGLPDRWLAALDGTTELRSLADTLSSLSD
ncbi:MAG: ADP-ribosylglycohydrolase family protein [Halobacteriaceae archaeon]